MLALLHLNASLARYNTGDQITFLCEMTAAKKLHGPRVACDITAFNLKSRLLEFNRQYANQQLTPNMSVLVLMLTTQVLMS